MYLHARNNDSLIQGILLIQKPDCIHIQYVYQFALVFSLFCMKKNNNEPSPAKKPFWLLLMDGVHMSQDYRATTRRQFTFYR